MKKIVLVIFIILQIFNTSCKEDKVYLNEPGKEIVFTLTDFPIADSLLFTNFSEINNHFLEPILKDSFLLFTVSKQKYGLNILSKETGKSIKTELKIGKGPNEILATFGQGIIDDSIYWTYEGETNTIRFFNLDSILKKNVSAKIIMTINFSCDRFPFKIIPISKNKFLINGSRIHKSKILLVDKNKKILKHIGNYYNLNFDSLQYIKGAFEYNLALKPDKKKIVLGYKYTDVIEIYDFETGNLIKALHGPDNFDVSPYPTKKMEQNYFRYNEETKDAYSIQASDKYIYAMYYGSRAKNTIYYGKYILVFDWSGNLIKYFKLKDKINQFVVDEKNNKIYAINVETGYIVSANFNIK